MIAHTASPVMNEPWIQPTPCPIQTTPTTTNSHTDDDPDPHGLLPRLSSYARRMLLDGMNHVAIITSDTERLHAFYRDVFDATVSHDMTEQEGVRLSFVDVGPHTELNVFEVGGEQ